MGRTFMDALDDPFPALDAELAACPMGAGCDVILAKGEPLNPLSTLDKGSRHTVFRASVTPAAAKKRWIAGVLRADLLDAPQQAPSIVTDKMRGALTDALRRPGAGR